jgi:transcriptional regulator with XRE-family HTH domain
MLEPDRHPDDLRALAESLRALRKAAKLSGERLAARCAMSQTKISRIETGRIIPTPEDVERILAALSAPAEGCRGAGRARTDRDDGVYREPGSC